MRVSVCVPAYNGAAFIERTIDSVLRQTFTDFELVICDNASKDATPEIGKKYTDPRVRYARFDELVPQGSNWNRCLSLAKADYVILLHADDVLLPDYLRRAVRVLDANPDVQIVHCSVEHIDTADNPIASQQLYESDFVDRSNRLLTHLLVDGCVVNPAGVLVRRSAFAAAGPFTDEVVWGVDWHMWLRIALHGPAAYIADTLSRYRQHPQSGTSSLLPTGRNARDESWVLRDIFNRIPASRRDLHALRGRAVRQVAHRTWCLAEEACRQGKMPSARTGIWNAVKISPRMVLKPRVLILWLATYFGYGMFNDLHSRFSRRRSAAGASGA